MKYPGYNRADWQKIAYPSVWEKFALQSSTYLRALQNAAARSGTHLPENIMQAIASRPEAHLVEGLGARARGKLPGAHTPTAQQVALQELTAQVPETGGTDHIVDVAGELFKRPPGTVQYAPDYVDRPKPRAKGTGDATRAAAPPALANVQRAKAVAAGTPVAPAPQPAPTGDWSHVIRSPHQAEDVAHAAAQIAPRPVVREPTAVVRRPKPTIKNSYDHGAMAALAAFGYRLSASL